MRRESTYTITLNEEELDLLGEALNEAVSERGATLDQEAAINRFANLLKAVKTGPTGEVSG